jgi:hypothetical protein
MVPNLNIRTGRQIYYMGNLDRHLLATFLCELSKTETEDIYLLEYNTVHSVES